MLAMELAGVEYRETDEGFGQFLEYVEKVHGLARKQAVAVMNAHPDVLRSHAYARSSIARTAEELLEHHKKSRR